MRGTMRASRGSRSTGRAIAARSPAHEWLPSSSKPSGELKRVHGEPQLVGAGRSSGDEARHACRGGALGERDRRVVAGRQQQAVQHRLDADPLALGRIPTPSPCSASASLVIAHLVARGHAVDATSAVIIFVSEAIGSIRVGSRR